MITHGCKMIFLEQRPHPIQWRDYPLKKVLKFVQKIVLRTFSLINVQNHFGEVVPPTHFLPHSRGSVPCHPPGGTHCRVIIYNSEYKVY